MSLELEFWGAVCNLKKGELGGPQIHLYDTEYKSLIGIDHGQRPDFTNEHYGFPYKPKASLKLLISEGLELYPHMGNLHRQDYRRFRQQIPKNIEMDAMLITHSHTDHIDGVTNLAYDLTLYYNRVTKQIAYIMQNTSGRTNNQYVDLIDQFSVIYGSKGEKRFVRGDEAIFSRDIRIYKENERFKIGNFYITAYKTDHSIPGTCGYILETSAGKIGISADIRSRGRRRHETEAFYEKCLEEKVDYLMHESSLVHLPSEGTEDDVSVVVSNLLKNKSFAAVAFAPRDIDRLKSLYDAAAANDRMLVISPQQALLLKVLDGLNDYPKLDSKYIGVYLHIKNKGLIDYPLDEYIAPEYEDLPEDLVKRDYFYYEREFIDKCWDGHKSKVQRVSLKNMRDHQDKFLVYLPYAMMIDVLEIVQPKPNSIYTRSHPAPYTADQEIMQNRSINILDHYEMYDGEVPDYLTPGVMRKMHQVHVPGHDNRRDHKKNIDRFPPNVRYIPYHGLDLDILREDFPNRELIIPNRGEKLVLEKNGNFRRIAS